MFKEIAVTISAAAFVMLAIAIMNIGNTFYFVGPEHQTQEIQRPKMCERFGSATRLKAGSHPIGGRESVVTTGDETVEVCFEASGSRSPLWV